MGNKFLHLILISFILGGCGLTVTRPTEEMSLAAASFLAAKEANAQKFTPNLFRKAEFYYLKAKSAYKRKYFNKAQQYAKLCKTFSEKAEYVSSIKKTEAVLQ